MLIDYLINFFLLFKDPFNKFINTILSAKMLVDRVDLLSVQTNFAPVELGMCF